VVEDLGPDWSDPNNKKRLHLPRLIRFLKVAWLLGVVLLIVAAVLLLLGH
jgi:hypothetical protein